MYIKGIVKAYYLSYYFGHLLAFPLYIRVSSVTVFSRDREVQPNPRSYIQVSRLVDFLSGGGVFTYGSHHLLRRTTTTRCSDREVTAAHAHSSLERDEIVDPATVRRQLVNFK